MSQHLENTDRFFWTRKSRFPEQFLGDIRAMFNSTVYEITATLEVSIVLTQLLSSISEIEACIPFEVPSAPIPELRWTLAHITLLESKGSGNYL